MQKFFGSLLGQIPQEVGRRVRSHFFQNVRRLFRIEFFHDLRGEPFVQFREDRCSSLLIQRGDNSLPLRCRQIFHDFGNVRGVQVLQLFMGDAQLQPAHGVRLNQIYELPANPALGQFALQLANHPRRHHSLEQPSDSSGKSHIHLRQAQLHVSVGSNRGEIDVIYAHDLAAPGINDLLIQQIFLNCQPGLIRLVELEGPFADA